MYFVSRSPQNLKVGGLLQKLSDCSPLPLGMHSPLPPPSECRAIKSNPRDLAAIVPEPIPLWKTTAIARLSEALASLGCPRHWRLSAAWGTIKAPLSPPYITALSY